MPNNKRKSLKGIARASRSGRSYAAAGTAAVTGDVHPCSRKASQIHRAMARAERMTKERTMARVVGLKSPVVERTLWFKYILEDEQTCVASLEELSALLDLYVERNDEELKQLRARHRKGQPRPKASREDALQAVREKDTVELHTSGFVMPNLLDPVTVATLRTWEGDLGGLVLIATVRVTRDEGNGGVLLRVVKEHTPVKQGKGFDKEGNAIMKETAAMAEEVESVEDEEMPMQ